MEVPSLHHGSVPDRQPLRRAMARIAWLVLALVAFEFLLITWRKYGHLDAGAYGMFWSRREWLWMHIGGGALGIVLGALQWSTPWHRTYPRLHRGIGRAYLLAMLLASAGAAGLIATSPAGLAFRIAFAATALAWLLTAFAGFTAIRARRQQAHRRWMVRGYLITLSPITFRAMIRVPGVMELAPPTVMIPALLWLSWVAPLLVHEAAIRAVDATQRAARQRLHHDGLGPESA
jgi:hypothetical protein